MDYIARGMRVAPYRATITRGYTRSLPAAVLALQFMLRGSGPAFFPVNLSQRSNAVSGSGVMRAWAQCWALSLIHI